jgi:hypothetical protein
MDPDMSAEERTEFVRENIEPVISLAGTSGHIVLYLGPAENGKLYFMHQAGWGYDDGDVHYYVNRVSINASDHPWYSITSPGVFTTFRP